MDEDGSLRLSQPSEAVFFEQISLYLSAADRELVRKGYELCQYAHRNTYRQSGEPYYTHPLTVAYYLAQYHLNAGTLIAALLHDVAEDTHITLADIETQFGAEVSHMVDGVTKLEAATTQVFEQKPLSKQQVQQASLRKLFEYTTNDVRVVLIKIFDRLHNMLTIQARPISSQRQNAQETLTVYAPLADRLGMWDIKNKLESLSLAILDEPAYQAIQYQLKQLEQQHLPIYQEISHQILNFLITRGIPVRNVLYTPQNIYTIYRDIQNKDKTVYDIDPTLQIAVLLQDELFCYTALGGLHQLWAPVPHKFDDYIATPRPNLYRSLHTTVAHSRGHIRIRLRTVEMHETSTIGILSQWLYQGTDLWSESLEQKVEALLAEIKESLNLEPQNVDSGVEGVVDNVLRDQIRVYTPKGEAVELRQGATAIDFAYQIHSELGHQTYRAYVNNIRFPLNQPLPNGAQVSIEPKRGRGPQRIWLDEYLGYLATTKAKSRVKQWFKRLSEEEALYQGQKLLEDELKILGLPHISHQKLAQRLGYQQPTALYYMLGRAEILPSTVANKIAEMIWDVWPQKRIGTKVESPLGATWMVSYADGRELQLCKSCLPEPGGRIVGFLRADDRVTVHRDICKLVPAATPNERLLKLEWGNEAKCDVRVVKVEVDVRDRVGLLLEITKLLTNEKINIAHFSMPHHLQEIPLTFELEITHPTGLVRVLHRLLALANVYAVYSLPDLSKLNGFLVERSS